MIQQHSPINLIPGGKSLAESFHEGEVGLAVVERPPVRDEPVKMFGCMVLGARGLLARRLNREMVP